MAVKPVLEARRASAALLASNLSSDNFYRRVIATYTNLTGIEVGCDFEHTLQKERSDLP